MKHQLVFALIIFSIASAYAGPINWTGAGDGESWEDIDNWDSGATPDANSVIMISSSSVVIHNGTIAFAESITCSGSLTIELGAVLAIEDASGIYSMSWTSVANSLVVEGTLAINNGGGINCQNGNITIGSSGLVQFDNISSTAFNMDLDNGYILDNQGTIMINNATGPKSINASLNNSGTIALDKAGTMHLKLENSGIIDFFKPKDGIYLYGVDNVNTGSISIDSNLLSRAIYLPEDSVVLTNSGEIEINAPAFFAISFNGQGIEINNEATGSINISGGDYGFIAQTFTNSTVDIFNSGTITLDDNGSGFTNVSLYNELGGNINIVNGFRGIWDTSEVASETENSGTITIENMGYSGIFKTTGATVVNSTSGVMSFIDCEINAIEANVNNSGQMTITGGSENYVSVIGNVINSGIMNFANLGYGGIEGDVTNTNSMIFVDIGGIGIDCYGNKSFNNSGSISFEDVQNGIWCTGVLASWVNTGSLQMDKMGSFGIFLSGVGNVEFASTSSLTIDSTQIGIRVIDCSFDIEADININAAENVALSALTDADVNIRSGVELSITNSRFGIEARQGSIVENEGLVSISDFVVQPGDFMFNYGIEIYSGAQIGNFASGIINITNREGSGVYIQDGSFINLGLLTGVDVNNVIINSDTFDNRPSGLIVIKDFNLSGINNFTGTFTNSGTIDLTNGFDATDFVNSNGGMLINTGTIISR